jgi:uncharacterized membrane protein YqjE
VLPSIPLAPESERAAGEQSIGGLVRDVTTHVSALVRGEIELAKTEITAEVKKGVTGSVFFVVAGVIGLFSLFFLFFTLGEVLDIWLPRWAAFAIVFAVMLLFAGIAALIGYSKVRKIRKPERTISSLKDTAEMLSSRGRHNAQPELPATASGATAR